MTFLQQANQALQNKNYGEAIPLYVQALQQHPPLAHVLLGNLQYAQRAYRKLRAQQAAIQPHVLVCAWDLSHNAAGRATTLAQIWSGIGHAEVIGCLYPHRKSQIWGPVQEFPLPIHPLHIVAEQSFIQQALRFVLKNPCDLLHLSKPRLPNILLGLLYKLVWACPVIMDVDDEELAFVKADSPISLDEYLQSGGKIPDTAESFESTLSTRLGVGLANAFDGVTVVNPALQQRYGGSIVRHARDAAHFAPSAQRRSQARARLGIAPGDTVILFAGTPRAHKGLLETAQAIAQQRRSDLVFLIVGDFPANLRSLQQQIARMPGLKTIMLPNQSFQTLPDTLAAGDICVLLQDPSSLAAQYQTPAKLTDALAMGLTVLATPTQALKDLAAQAAFIPVSPGTLPNVLAEALVANKQHTAAAHPVFTNTLSLHANQTALRQLWQAHASQRAATQSHFLISLAQMHPLTAPLQGKADASTAAARKPELNGKIAIAAHIYYPELWPEIAAYLRNISHSYVLDITTTEALHYQVSAMVQADFPQARIHSMPNLGMDILPFLRLVSLWQQEGIHAVCKLHTKKGDNSLTAQQWRKHQLHMLLGQPGNIFTISQAFSSDPQLSLLGSSVLFLSGQKLMYDNTPALTAISQATTRQPLSAEDWGFFAGTMFWARPAALLSLAEHAIQQAQRFTAHYAKDGSYEDALERAFGLLAYQQNKRIGLLYPIPATAQGQPSAPSLALVSAQQARQLHHINPVHASQAVRQTYSVVDWAAIASKPRQMGLTSIIIPIYNQPELTAACVQSLYAHTEAGSFELILVDNGSDTATQTLLQQLAQQHPNIHLHRNTHNLNFAQACNQGFAASQGQTIVFLNNDTTVTPHWLPPLLHALQQPGTAAVQPRLLYPDGSLQCVGVVFSDKSTLGYPIYAGMPADAFSPAQLSRPYQAITAACMAMRAQDFAALRGFDTLYVNGQEDVDLCLRLNQYHGTTSCRVAAQSTVIHHESKTPGRFKHVDNNRRHFVQRWQGRVKADDARYYQQDGYTAIRYAADSQKRPADLQVWRPELNRQAGS